ncbi:hypothetical protein J5X84_28575 [Streptosporangiaceae bacterium NEAU-GS5]|nr:hypothetical protein [Streptosporangiaceae bacterium NEAU-GS5]
MSTPDENREKTGTEPLLDAAMAEAQDAGEPRTTGRRAMEEALERSGQTYEDLTRDEDADRRAHSGRRSEPEDATSVEPDGERYGFAFDDLFRLPLSLMGVRPESCHLTISSQDLTVRFGPWVVRSPLSNVAAAEVTGPYSAIKAIGMHVSLADRGLTFGTTTERGVCVRFHQPIRGADPVGLIRHPGLTVTVDDAATVATRLRELSDAGPARAEP